MDSLELPFDLIWEGKPEPLSPADLLLANAEDVLIFDKDFADGFGLTNPDFLKSERCEDEAKLQGPLAMLLQLQQQALAIDDDDDDACDYDDASVDVLTEAEADQWLNQSMNFFPLDVYGSVATATSNNNTMRAVTTTNMLPSPMQTTTTTPTTVKIEQTAQLIREFDSVFEVVELTHLTPPQSPPRMPEPKQTGFIFPSQPIFHALSNTNTNNHPINTTNTTNNAAAAATNYFLFDGTAHTVAASPMTQDIAQEMEVVEELVRARAENLPDWTDEDEYDDDNNSLHSSTLDDASMSNSAIMMPPSPAPSSSSSSRSSSSSSSSFDSSAGSSPRSESSYDADWKPNAIGVPAVASSKKTKTTTAASASAAPQRRVRPYGRSSEDKKSRKKEQNKNAATRYRQKKKAEIEVALDEERDLLDVHSGLLVRCADVQREIKYLKSLMRDLYRAKKTA